MSGEGAVNVMVMVRMDKIRTSWERGWACSVLWSRLPPRVRVREAASIELPHIMVLPVAVSVTQKVQKATNTSRTG